MFKPQHVGQPIAPVVSQSEFSLQTIHESHKPKVLLWIYGLKDEFHSPPNSNVYYYKSVSIKLLGLGSATRAI